MIGIIGTPALPERIDIIAKNIDDHLNATRSNQVPAPLTFPKMGYRMITFEKCVTPFPLPATRSMSLPDAYRDWMLCKVYERMGEVGESIIMVEIHRILLLV